MSEQVAGDRKTVTERWTVEPCPECGDIALCGCGLEQCGHHGERNPVEVVPASQLQEAVEALELILRHASLDVSERGCREAERYVAIAWSALNCLRGR